MPRPRKKQHPLTIKLDQTVYDEMVAFCEQSGQSKTVAIERALIFYIDAYTEERKIIEEYHNKHNSLNTYIKKEI